MHKCSNGYVTSLSKFVFASCKCCTASVKMWLVRWPLVCAVIGNDLLGCSHLLGYQTDY